MQKRLIITSIINRLHMDFGGEGGIRTHGRLPYAGFQDRYFRPAQSPLLKAAQYTVRKSNFPVIIGLEIRLYRLDIMN